MTKRSKILLKIFLIAIPSILTLLWLCFIYGNSLQTGVESGATSGRVHSLINSVTEFFGLGRPFSEHFVRKAAHFTEFAILSLLISLDLWAYKAISLSRKLYINALVILTSTPISAIFASADEILQNFVDGRGPSPKDVLIDTSGAFAATIAFILIYALIQKIYAKHIDRSRVNI